MFLSLNLNYNHYEYLFWKNFQPRAVLTFLSRWRSILVRASVSPPGHTAEGRPSVSKPENTWVTLLIYNSVIPVCWMTQQSLSCVIHIELKSYATQIFFQAISVCSNLLIHLYTHFVTVTPTAQQWFRSFSGGTVRRWDKTFFTAALQSWTMWGFPPFGTNQPRHMRLHAPLKGANYTFPYFLSYGFSYYMWPLMNEWMKS